ncbi:hypothetical protein EJ08DRAFT_633866 [Tothia fuscella]|uniref:tRNA A64-2'-O-ribosylphosphate transferase n=1 Tax=Tothia fuscella TaxID=1048955 RepID=A0A9P4NRM2_9PEZI|nr:hypothetical protein EJ08DRAFT_633866 [Tothia fuscella]
MARPLQTSDLIFPELATNFSETLNSLKRSTLSITNRLRSITEDSHFVRKIADAYELPLVANERCGSWYIPPERKNGSAYFKSTDGHNGQWSFSLRRLNAQVLDIIGRESGCIVVDSTRRGKSMPDSLSKTVPIWCAVFNRLLFPDISEAHKLHTSPKCVSSSEHSQIENKLDEFTRQLKDLRLDIEVLRTKVGKPMRPIWVTRDSNIPVEPLRFTDFHPVILCTASRRVAGGEISEGGYIQGAGDDSEGWAQGLTAQLFWQHRAELFNTTEEDLPSLISYLLESKQIERCSAQVVLIEPTYWLFVGMLANLAELSLTNSDLVITCGDLSQVPAVIQKHPSHVHLQCRDRKLGSRDLRKELHKIMRVHYLHTMKRLIVCCPTGKDLSVGVALAILCQHAKDFGKFERNQKLDINKALIKQRLSWIMTSYPSASPARATLQSVNDFLLTSDWAAPVSTQVPKAIAVPDVQCTLRGPFSSLSGEWRFNREITNFHHEGFAGLVSGTASFGARSCPTNDLLPEFLYIENGVFKTTTSLEMNATRRWIWRLSETKSSSETPGHERTIVQIYFVKADGESEDYLYNELEFKGKSGKALVAYAEHPCGDDFYKSTYTMFLTGEGVRVVERFEIVHEVKGPSKDYISKTLYSRINANERFGIL